MILGIFLTPSQHVHIKCVSAFDVFFFSVSVTLYTFVIKQ